MRLALAVSLLILGGCAPLMRGHSGEEYQRGWYCDLWERILTTPEHAWRVVPDLCFDDARGCAFQLAIALRAAGREIPRELLERIRASPRFFSDECTDWGAVVRLPDEDEPSTSGTDPGAQ